MVSHAYAGKCAAADPEGFAHSAAAEGRRERRNGSAAAKAGHGRVGGRMEMSLWLGFRACLCADVPQIRATISKPAGGGSVGNVDVPYSVRHGKGECGCGASFVHIEGSAAVGG